jgi:hypothetical protein
MDIRIIAAHVEMYKKKYTAYDFLCIALAIGLMVYVVIR